MIIRPEQPADVAAIHRVHVAAFPTDAEAKLVDRLREAGLLTISLVALVDGEIAGHIAFSPVMLHGRNDSVVAAGLGLAPVAVLPPHQRRGVGTKLIEEGIIRCKATDAAFIVVLGHAEYYPRFGFTRASGHAIGNEYGADDHFMVILLRGGAIPATGGVARFSAPFAAL